MEIRFLGHSTFELTHDGVTLLIDPFLTGNPKAAATADEVSADAILVTHGHGDHVGDAVEIAKRTGKPLLLGTVFTTGTNAADPLWYNGAFVVDPLHGVRRGHETAVIIAVRQV